MDNFGSRSVLRHGRWFQASGCNFSAPVVINPQAVLTHWGPLVAHQSAAGCSCQRHLHGHPLMDGDIGIQAKTGTASFTPTDHHHLQLFPPAWTIFKSISKMVHLAIHFTIFITCLLRLPLFLRFGGH